jgi:hypothetical protein
MTTRRTFPRTALAGGLRRRTPSGLRRRAVSTRVVLLALVVVLGASSLAACSGDDDDAGSATTTAPSAATTTTPGTAPVGAAPEGALPRPSAVEAVEALLAAEVELDRATSFTTIGGALRDEFPTLGAWERRRNQLGTPTDFGVEPGPTDDVVLATVTHEPSLDPFRGLIFAEEHQTWTAVAVDGGWLVAAEPEVEPVVPDEALAVETATAWAEAVRACDPETAATFEGVSILFGDGSVALGLCGASTGVEAGTPGPLPSGVVSADIVAQYSSDALLWARVVPITAPIFFGVVLAPIGSGWKVIGLVPS